MDRSFLQAAGLALAVTAAAPAAADPYDPLERFNRGVFVFNEQVDTYVAKPVARAYQTVTPAPVNQGITNFFRNLAAPITVVNYYLQWRPHDATTQLARFMFNSTFGLGGFVDMGTRMGLPHQKTDFGMTLGRYGSGPGAYLMLPFLGPSTVRDFGGRIVDAGADARTYMHDDLRWSLLAVDVIDTRADLLRFEKTIIGDRYTFLRDAYLQSRAFAISGGVVESDSFLEDSLELDEQSTETY